MNNRTRKHPKTYSHFDAGRAQHAIESAANRVRGLTPARLAGMLDGFDHGYLGAAAELWEKILDRDDQAIACSTKRLRAATRLTWEILPIEDSDEARRHKAVLEEFYNNISVTNVTDEHERGGVELLCRQMLTAIGMRYAVHEIVWQPRPDGMSAELRFVPLRYFERFSGALRFLPHESAINGVELEPGGWMVTKGDGLMAATSVAYLLKSMPLKSWVTFCEKFGVPGIHGQTPAAKGSDEWNALAEAIAAFGEDLAVITNEGAKITPIALNQVGELPQPLLVDRMDRAISRIWLGSDLATMSSSAGSLGATTQSSGLENLEQGDAAMVSDSIQQSLDPWVIRYRLGADKPKAYFKLIPRANINTELQLRVDEFLINAGVAVSKKDLLERYGRAEPDAGDELANRQPSEISICRVAITG